MMMIQVMHFPRSRKASRVSGTFDDLTDEQKARFQGVMENLEKLDVPELLAESARLRMPKPITEALKPRYRSNFAGAIAAQKVLAYIQELGAANDRRIELGAEITRINEEADNLDSTDPVQAAAYRVTTGRLAGMQEVAIHRFASAIERISVLLPAATKTSGYKLSAQDRALLENYVSLRDYYEHLEERLPGGKFDEEACIETDDGRGWRITMELPTDKIDGMIELRGSRIDVSSDAVMDVIRVMQRAWADLRASALAEVQKHFLAHPEHIPDPNDVRDAILAQLGGVLPYWERKKKGEEQIRPAVVGHLSEH
jgi:hypothetical protein